MLQGKNAVITGAGSGIGRAIVDTFAKNGANIWAVVHKTNDEIEKMMSAIAEEQGIWIRVVEMEMHDQDSVKSAVKSIATSGDNVDILVNNAGIPSEKTLGMTSVEDMRRTMDINFIVPSYIIQMVSRKMIKQNGGTIINITSRSGVEVRAGVYAYGASKAALIWGTKAAAKELSQFNIRVNGIAPGLTETKMGSLGRDDEFIERYVSANNIKRPATTDEIAEAALFLASDRSSYISGQILSVDGGRD
ncbi:MAG: SDR family oxidoreductase [Lachnospiraceae bacterium]|nr:SDR family oxidoreductase [Lachnospiraceae bacterium]